LHQLRQKSSKAASIAAVLTEFLPMRDQLEQLKEQFSGDEFGKQYNAIPVAMEKALEQLGVTEYTMAVGEPIKNIINESRCIIIDREYSDQVAKDTVLRPLRIGLELEGNIIRPAECIASLGSEQAAAALEQQELQSNEAGEQTPSEGEGSEEVSSSAEETA
jgi:molecular chaperone GrpE (heat shock protein)